jgi:phage tail-like protein
MATALDARLSAALAAPPVASRRGYLRSGLPAQYQEGDFGMRFVGGLEGILDAVVCLVDGLHRHFDPALAPHDILELEAAWLGIDLDESWPEDHRRRVIAEAVDLVRRRGTTVGIQRALALAFPELDVTVVDAGSVRFGDDLARPVPPAEFTVRCPQPIDGAQRAALLQAIERLKPVHAGYRLEAGGAAGDGGEEL